MLILPSESDPYPVVDKAHWDKTNADPALQAMERDRCSIEPLYFLLNYVYTLRKDEQVDGGVTERFPADEYLLYIFNKFFTEPKLAIDKARQMRMTWLMMAGYLWYVQYRQNEEVIVQTKKEEDADAELIKRAEFIWRNEPLWLRPDAKCSYCKFAVPSMNSKILGIPKGADQIRSKNPTRTFLDEGGFFEGEFMECYSAALACCKDVKAVSTANAGDWEDFIHDHISNN